MTTDTTTPPSLSELIKNRRWDEAKHIVQSNPNSTYQTDTSNARTPLHILCRMQFDDEDNQEEDDQKSPPTLKHDDDEEEDDKENISAHVSLSKILIEASHNCAPVILPDPDEMGPTNTNNEDTTTTTTSSSEMVLLGHSYSLHRSVLTVRDYLGNTPLHYLCSGGASSSSGSPYLLNMILSMASDAGDGDDDGTPHKKTSSEHVKCSSSSSSAPTTLELVSARNLHGCTPLHFVCEGLHSLTTTTMFFDYYEQAFRLASQMVTDVDHDHDDQDEDQINSSPSKARKAMMKTTLQYYYLPIHPTMITDDDGDTPLHFACSVGLSPDFMQSILKVEPKSSLMQNKEGRTPLDDVIVRYLDSCDVGDDNDDDDGVVVPTRDMLWVRVEVLLRKMMLGVGIRNVMSYHGSYDYDESCWSLAHTAAILATSHPSLIPAYVVFLALTMTPHTSPPPPPPSYLKNDDEEEDERWCWTPLHAACATNHHHHQNDNVILYPSAETYKELVRFGTKDEPRSVIRFLLDQHKCWAEFWTVVVVGGRKIRDDDDDSMKKNHKRRKRRRLPLHLVLDRNSSVDLEDVQALLSCHPESLNARDEVTGLFPFMLAAAASPAASDDDDDDDDNDGCSIDVIYSLLLANPELI